MTCFDTAHWWFKNKELPNFDDLKHVKFVHLNGLDKKAYESNREKHTYPNGRNDIIGYQLDKLRSWLDDNNI